MKKIMTILMMFILTASASACASNTPNPTEAKENSANSEAVLENSTDAIEAPAQPQAATEEKPIKNADGFVFVYNGINVYMDENMADVLTRLGAPSITFEAPSCAFDGIDKIFGYPGVEIHTYPENGTDYVHTVNFKDDTIETPEGIYLGSSLADVLAAYGDQYQQDMGLYTYSKGQTYLSFIIEDDEVRLITFGLTM